MMLITLILAVLMLAFAAFAAFGVPWLIAGPRAFDDFAERRDQHLMAGVLATAAISLACLPLVSSALISAAPHVQVFAETVLGVSARFWS